MKPAFLQHELIRKEESRHHSNTHCTVLRAVYPKIRPE